MAGKPGMKSVKPRSIEPRYTRNFLTTLHGSSRLARVMVDRQAQLYADLGADPEQPEAHLSYQQRSLVNRALWLEQRLLELEDEYGKGCGLDTDEYTKLVQTLMAVYRALGIQRRARPVKSLAEYLAEEAEESSPPPATLSQSTDTGPVPSRPAADEGSP